jgi:hypothetical protein
VKRGEKRIVKLKYVTERKYFIVKTCLPAGRSKKEKKSVGDRVRWINDSLFSFSFIYKE